MHWVKLLVASEQLLPHDEFWAAAAWAWTGAAASGAAEEPPPENMPPMAWPMEEPMATPLFVYSLLVYVYGFPMESRSGGEGHGDGMGRKGKVKHTQQC